MSQKNKVFRFSIKKKMIIIYILISLLPIAFVMYVETRLFVTSMENNIGDTVRLSLNQNRKKLNRVIEDINNLMFTMAVDRDILDMVREYKDKGYTALLGNRIIDSLVEYGDFWDEMVRAISVLSPDNEIKGYDFHTDGSIFDNSIIPEERWRNKFQELENAHAIHDYPVTLFTNSSLNSWKSYVCELALPIRDLYTKEVFSILSLYINTDYLYELIALPAEGSSRIRINEYIVNGAGEIIIGRDVYSGNMEDLFPFLDFAALLEKGVFHTSTYQYSILPLNYYDWHILYIVDKESYLSETKSFILWTLFFFGFISFITLFVIIAFSNSIVGSLNKIITGMKTVRDGRISTLVSLQTKDELALVEKAFNEMTHNISNLIGQIQQQGADLVELSEKQRQYELRTLENQINPHFIYNTLDSINWMAIDKDEDEISFMLKTLADIMRYSTSSIESAVPLGTEIDYIRKYLTLQKARFNNKFTYEIDVDPGLNEFSLYKLILQPFVENAIIHGLNGLERPGEIGIRIWEDGNRVFFLFRDNGRGMDGETLKGVRESMAEEEQESGIGMKNVYNRLKIYFGERFDDFRIESEPAMGTVITFSLERSEHALDDCGR